MLQVSSPRAVNPGAGRVPSAGELSLATVASAVGHPLTPPGAGSDLDLAMLLADHSGDCKTVLLTNVFTTREDPQAKRHGMPTFEYFERYYRSILSLPSGRASAVIFYDDLPEDLVRNYTSGDGAVSFTKVDISGLDPIMGLNDLRYQVFEEHIKKHPEWETIFMTDINDVTVIHNPCAFVDRTPDKLFVGSQTEPLKPREFIHHKFEQAGGKYLKWYEAQPDFSLPLLNAGIIGGKRSVVLRALRKVNEMLEDPELPGRKMDVGVRINMEAVNYVFYTAFGRESLVTGVPLHSKFYYFQNRTDVYFWHK